MNAHIDYKAKALGGPFLQQLFRLPGYTNSIYYSLKKEGALDLSDGRAHPIRIEVRDVFGHSSILAFELSYRAAPSKPGAMPGKMCYPGMLDGAEWPDCAYYIAEKSLYDSVHINYTRLENPGPHAISAIHSIGATYIPLQEPFLVRIRPNAKFDSSKNGQVVMQRLTGAKKEVQKVQWQGGWASARFREFGHFQLLLDEEPPRILPLGFSNGANLSRASRIVILVKDNLEAYKNFRAELDGKWLRFSNDKGKAFIYQFDEHCPAGQHELKITVEDEAGNKATRVLAFTR